MLYNRTIDGTPKVGMLVGYNPGLVAYAIKHVLHHIRVSNKVGRSDTCLQATLSQKLIPCSKRHLYNRPKFGVLACNVILNVCKALKVGNELLHNSLPSNEALNEDVGWFEVLRSYVFLYE